MNNSFFKNLKSKFNIDLNPDQKKAVMHNHGPALVLAVPGAGKTTVLISRTASLISVHGVDPSKILSITFSKASAQDMLSRFKSTFGDSIGGVLPKFSTIHSFAFFVLRDYFKLSGKSYDLIQDSGKHGRANILRMIHKEINNSFLSDDKLEEVLNSIGFIKNMMISPNEFKSAGVKNFSEIFEAYEAYKSEHGLIDFDDMLVICYEAFTSNPRLLNSYRDKYSYIQVDEGQDTSNIQHKIIELLAAPNQNLL